jgi:NADP-dependent 3-hydroxy acid dehydrogenase YdfG
MSNAPVKALPASALIVGAGSGLSAALAVEFASHGLAVTLAARRPDKLAALCAQTGATALACDAAQPGGGRPGHRGL